MADIDTKAVARAKMRDAMRLVEEAQNIVLRAAQELSPIIHGAPENARLIRLYDRIKSEWYKLERALQTKGHKLDLDEMARARLEREASGGQRV
jgi:hypothetical protein